MSTPTPTALERLRFATQALGSAVLGAAALFAWVVWSDGTRAPHAFGGDAPPELALAILVLSLVAIGWNLGRAIVPDRVVQAGAHLRFATATALFTVGIVFAVPSPLACLSWPIAAIALAGGGYLIATALRPRPAP